MEGLFLLQSALWMTTMVIGCLMESYTIYVLSIVSLCMTLVSYVLMDITMDLPPAKPFVTLSLATTELYVRYRKPHFEWVNVLFVSYLFFWLYAMSYGGHAFIFSGAAFFVYYIVWIYVTCQYEIKNG